jgi:hypothetical protein
MKIDMKKVAYKLDVLAKADDFTSDRAAARALGISHSTIFKYRRQLRAQSREESIRQLGAPQGRPRRTVLNRDRDFMVWWIRCENKEWNNAEVAKALRGLGGGRIREEDVARVPPEKPKVFSFPDPSSEEIDARCPFEAALERNPTRILYMLVSITENQARTSLGVIGVGRRFGLIDDTVAEEGERNCRAQLATARAMKKTLKEKEGSGCALEDLLQTEVRIEEVGDFDLRKLHRDGSRLEPILS